MVLLVFTFGLDEGVSVMDMDTQLLMAGHLLTAYVLVFAWGVVYMNIFECPWLKPSTMMFVHGRKYASDDCA